VCHVNSASLSQEEKEEPRSSKRTRQQPVHYGEEQAQQLLQAQELLDLRRAMEASLESDVQEESPEEPAPPDIPSEEEEEEVEEAAADSWSTSTADVNAPAFLARTGKQHEACHSESPMEFLHLFLPPGLVQHWADYTNDYAQRRGAERGWRTTTSELYAFIGVHIYMGICPLPQWHMYWSAEYQQPFVASVFPRWRFEQLLRYFHIAPPSDADAPRDPLSRARPLIQSLNQSFARQYLPSRCLALDETIVAFKGRSSMKQYIPSKPHKWGYKIWCLANENYLLHFEVYEGKPANGAAIGSTLQTALRMTANYHHQQHVIFTDNYFTSPALAVALLQKGTLLCGSVRSNRREMPVIPQERVDSLRYGEWIQRQKHDLCVAVWKSRKPVWVLYNHCSPRQTTSLEQWNDAHERVSVGCPRAVEDYFFNARSVDVINQLHYSYLIGRKSKKCWWRLAWWLIDMCIVNAFKLWSMQNQGVSHLSFRERLMHSLVKLFAADRHAVQASRGADVSVALARDHFPERTEEARRCMYCKHSGDDSHRSVYICHHCKVHLCVDPCFGLYHRKL
jgi:hypothetical protein